MATDTGKKNMATDTGNGENKQEAADPNAPEFAIQRIYVKDSSFEAPNAPEIFKENWEPKVNIDLHTSSTHLEDNINEVTLGVTVTVKAGEKVAFITEVKQSGIFTVAKFPDDQLKHVLGSFCPNILFPYAREAITAMVSRGGFPQIYLAPINFDAIYQQQLEQQEKEAKGSVKQ